MASWKLPLLPALFISLILMVPSHCTVDLTSTTLAISQATGTVCGITAASQHHTIQCARISESANMTASFPIYPTISFDALSGGHNLICGLRSGGSAFFCWDGIVQRMKHVYNGPTVLTQLAVEEGSVVLVDRDRTIHHWKDGCSHVELCGLFPTSTLGEYHFLTSGNDFTCAINGHYSVHCWGPGGKPIQAKFSGTRVHNITAGGGRLCGLNETGHLICTGDQSIVPSGEAFEFTSLAIGSSQTCAISRRNGTVICWGPHGSYFPMRNTEFDFIIAGGDLTCGLTSYTLVVICWGLNGSNSSVVRSLPKILPGVCVPDKTICSCGVYPDSGVLCGCSGVICKKYGTATTDSCRFYSSAEKWKILINGPVGVMIAFVNILLFFMGCFFVYLLWFPES